ncbi:hypothetical protein [Lactococcus kimchii]|uniref:hypothetical protein n=1 Tax=Lactococcus sp. S-13 TaxID=2507158 RepID=UPI0010236C68|nr:hypothetical protein [Lactococcus sp. S-13]RZI47974.1 hypothetical protein EQJ87_00085 [Lactococcus sp. S-13]RZI48775.1 hypothetical protein EQJ87_04605 [Lactococcus sp. S-13]
MATNEKSFPWDDHGGDREYGSDDFGEFFSILFKPGVVPNASNGNALQITESGSLGMRVKFSAGAAFSAFGRTYIHTLDEEVTVPLASTLQDRTDSIVIQFNKSQREALLLYKEADVTVTRTSTIFELQIAKILVPRNGTKIVNANITDMRADEKVCGYYGPNGILKTGDLLAQFKSQLEANGIVFSEWFATVKADLQVELTNMENFMDTSKTDLQSWVTSVKAIIEAVDPGGQLLAELTDLKQKTEKYIPTGFTFILEHDSEYQPEVKVTSYKNALGTEVNGLGTGPIFGRERLYNVPVSLSYDRKKAYVEMPTSFKIDGDITIIDDKTLVIIDKPQTLCFEMSGAKITKGYKA